MDSTSTFGKDLGIIYQIVMLGRKHGMTAKTWKTLANKEVLAYVIDFVAFLYGVTFTCTVDDEKTRKITLVAFAENDMYYLNEVEGRTKRFGRLATDVELGALWSKLRGLWKEGDLLSSVKFPILACRRDDIAQHPEYAFCINLNSSGEPVLEKIILKMSSDCSNNERFCYWNQKESITFATVVTMDPLREVLGSRQFPS